MVRVFFCFLAVFALCYGARWKMTTGDRRPASLGRYQAPTPDEEAAAKASDILVFGAERDRESQKRFFERFQGENPLGIYYSPEMPDTERDRLWQVNATLILGRERVVSYIGRFQLLGESGWTVVQIRRADAGIESRHFSFSQRKPETFLYRPGECDDDAGWYSATFNALVIPGQAEELQRNRYEHPYIEFPLRGVREFSGRYLAWNVDKEAFEELGSVRWQWLSPVESRTVQQSWNEIWTKEADAVRGGNACTGPGGMDAPVPLW